MCVFGWVSQTESERDREREKSVSVCVDGERVTARINPQGQHLLRGTTGTATARLRLGGIIARLVSIGQAMA